MAPYPDVKMHMQRGTLDKKNLGHLRLAMPLFSDAILKASAPIDELTDYLQFYRLPQDTSNLKLTAGTTEDHETVIMSWRPTKSLGTVIVVHGYMDHIGLYGHLIRHLLGRQLTVVCLDLKGHGLSSGAACSITTLVTMLLKYNQSLPFVRFTLRDPCMASVKVWVDLCS